MAGAGCRQHALTRRVWGYSHGASSAPSALDGIYGVGWMKHWFVPPIVIPVVFVAAFAAYVLFRALS